MSLDQDFQERNCKVSGSFGLRVMGPGVPGQGVTGSGVLGLGVRGGPCVLELGVPGSEVMRLPVYSRKLF